MKEIYGTCLSELMFVVWFRMQQNYISKLQDSQTIMNFYCDDGALTGCFGWKRNARWLGTQCGDTVPQCKEGCN